MKRKLIICNTYYQLILAIQMKLTIFKNDIVDLQISDQSVNASDVAKRLNKLSVFNSVKFVENKDEYATRSAVKKIKDVFVHSFVRAKNLEIPLYDEILFYNFETNFYKINDYYKKINHKVIWSRMEEGIFSYSADCYTGGTIKLTSKVRKILCKDNIIDNITRYYCTEPEIASANGMYKDIVEIPKINANDVYLVEILNNIFDYKYEKINQKYIFFASSSDIDGVPFGETELILKVADEVGKDNIIVKMHPRDTRRVYQEYGIEVMEKSCVPWEVIQLNMLRDEHILLTVTSGAFLGIASMTGDIIKGYFLYNCIENKSEYLKGYIQNIQKVFYELKKENKCNGLFILNE